MTNLPELLERTSRTFALAIPLLPEPTRTDVTVAYLVFRIADTLEDAERLTAEEKIEALEDFHRLLDQPTSFAAESFATSWGERKVTDTEWYQVLVQHTPLVLQQLRGREPQVDRWIRSHARRTTLGMIAFLRRRDHPFQSLGELQRYCYLVAGIVGELLTEFFSARIKDLAISHDLREQARAFGEGLQLVNILKDLNEDQKRGRVFVPKSVSRETLLRLARQDLQVAREYVGQLERVNAEPGYLAFTTLPLELAAATLDRIELEGPGAKVPRAEVLQIMEVLQRNGNPTKL